MGRALGRPCVAICCCPPRPQRWSRSPEAPWPRGAPPQITAVEDLLVKTQESYIQGSLKRCAPPRRDDDTRIESSAQLSFCCCFVSQFSTKFRNRARAQCSAKLSTRVVTVMGCGDEGLTWAHPPASATRWRRRSSRSRRPRCPPRRAETDESQYCKSSSRSLQAYN